MFQQAQESNDGPEGLFFCPEIVTFTELERWELALWMGRGACFGWDLEERAMFQRYLEEQRARLNGDAVLGSTLVV